MRNKIRLDTLSDIHEFVRIVNNANVAVKVKDNAGHCVNAKSILGMMYSMEWDEIWCECDTDIYDSIKKFVL